MVSFTTLLTIVTAASAAAVPNAEVPQVFKRDTCNIVPNVGKFIGAVQALANGLLNGTSNLLQEDLNIVKKLGQDLETIVGGINAKCIGDDLSALTGLTDTLKSLSGAVNK